MPGSYASVYEEAGRWVNPLRDEWEREYDRKADLRKLEWDRSVFKVAWDAMNARVHATAAEMYPVPDRTVPVLPAEMHLLLQQPLPAD